VPTTKQPIWISPLTGNDYRIIPNLYLVRLDTVSHGLRRGPGSCDDDHAGYRSGSDGRDADAIRAGDIDPPSEVAEVPAQLDETLLRGLETDPEDRYQSPLAFSRALTSAW
jgi:hypothetical protein